MLHTHIMSEVKGVFYIEDKDNSYWFDCPGCKKAHCIYFHAGTTSHPVWSWNRSFDKPTVSPSVLVRWHEGKERKQCVCHSFISDGNIQFLSDCTHELAGKTVPIPEWVGFFME